MINKKSKIYIAGHKGMVGSSLLRIFQKKGYTNLLTRTKKQLNLLDFIVNKNFKASIRLDKFKDSSIDILIYCFTSTND